MRSRTEAAPSALWLWWRERLLPQLRRFFVFPFGWLACLLFGHKPLHFLQEGKPPIMFFQSHPLPGVDGVTVGDRQRRAGVTMLVCARCQAVYGLPGLVDAPPILSHSELRRLKKARQQLRAR